MNPGRLGRAGKRLALAAPRAAGGFTSEWATVDGVRLHCRAASGPGSGTPVLLVHGLAVSHRYLMPLAAALAARHPVLVPDLPGFGLSGRPRRVLDVRAHAAHLAGLLDARRTAPVAVVGHSFGAEVAAALAADRPDLVCALVLGGPTSDAAARTRRGQIGRWLRDLLVEDPRQAGILARDVRDAGPRRILRTLGHSVCNAIEDDVARVRVPTLAVRGARDPVAPLAWTRRLARTAVLPAAGHNCATTAAAEFAHVVTGLLAGVRTGTHESCASAT